MPKVTIYTQVYNAKEYVEQCVSSVLNQTFSDFQYIIVDSASTDGSSEILDAFAQQDSRINLIRLQENQIWASNEILPQHATGDYCVVLDHDDWIEPNFLESLLSFAEKNNLDIACTGTTMHLEGTEQQTLRCLPQPLILDRQRFPDAYPLYHQFFRTRWNKLVRTEYVLQAHGKELPPLLPYGGDTILCFRFLRYARRIGIDNTILQHYRIHRQSQSYQYDSQRIEADVCCYNDALDFLSLFGPVSEQNLLFARCVYANAVLDTVKMIDSSTLSTEEKVREYRKIAEQPITQEVYHHPPVADDLQRSRETFFWTALQMSSRPKGSCADISAIMRVLSPCCASVIVDNTIELFAQDKALARALLNNDKKSITLQLLHFLSKNQYVKKYPIETMFQSALSENSPLHVVKNPKFLGKYTKIVTLILQNDYMAALEQMTALLLNRKHLYDKETFLQVYLTVAALENQSAAFIFGKIRLAELYQQTSRQAECLSVIAELEEMGVGSHEEVLRLRQAP